MLLINVSLLTFVMLGQIQPSAEILNGQATDITEFPWTATINVFFLNWITDFNCGGVIIGKKWILTAAHCDTTHFWGKFEIRVGANSPDFRGERILIKSVIPHPQYNPVTLDHDIKLIELDQELEYSNKIKAIRMADQNFNVTEDLDVKIAAFGETCDGLWWWCSYSETLLEADFTTLKCVTYQTKSAEDSEELICALDQNDLQGLCRGDSGNGLVFVDKTNEPLLLGILSQGKCTGGSSSSYAFVPAYRKWIKEHVKF